MSKPQDLRRASDKLALLARGQTITALLFVVFVLFFLFLLALNCLYKLPDAYGWATFVFLVAILVLTPIHIAMKRSQLTLEIKLFRQKFVRRPHGGRETLWRLFMPGQWMRDLQVDRPHAEIEMTAVPDLERPLPVSTRARY